MSTSDSTMPLFTKSMDFLEWLIPCSNHFPRLHRHTITRRLLDAALDFFECAIDANRLRGHPRLSRLQMADGHLDKVRLYLRLVFRLQWLSSGQYEHVSRMVSELGRILGGWIIATRNS